jgi:ABC-type sugar transport system permease subunit
MRVGWRIVLGIAALWASVYALAVLAGDYAFVPAPYAERVVDDTALGPAFRWASMFNALIVFLLFAVIAALHPTMRALDKVGWIVAMMFLYPVVVPPFWYLHVWRQPS